MKNYLSPGGQKQAKKLSRRLWRRGRLMGFVRTRRNGLASRPINHPLANEYSITRVVVPTLVPMMHYFIPKAKKGVI